MFSRLVTLCAVVSIGSAIYMLADPIQVSPTVNTPYVSERINIALPASPLVPMTVVGASMPAGYVLYVPSVGIELPIERGIYSSGKMTWNVPGNNAYLADGSAAPNNVAGTSYIYGHKNKHAFAALSKIKTGDVAVIKNGNNSFYYELVDSRVTDPNDLSLLTNEGQPTLVLQTCTGLMNEYRAQYIFRLTRTA